MRSPSPEGADREYKPILHEAPAWVQDCGVDDMLEQIYGKIQIERIIAVQQHLPQTTIQIDMSHLLWIWLK